MQYRARRIRAHITEDMMDNMDSTVQTGVDEVENLISAARLALRYLRHPDVAGLPFAMSSSHAARRLADALDAIRS